MHMGYKRFSKSYEQSEKERGSSFGSLMYKKNVASLYEYCIELDIYIHHF